jgi:predicted RNA binding protein YcfA (HicA-like mRNA interferase family)
MKGTLSQKKAIKLLRENGWTQARGGKHQVKMTKLGSRPITLPQHKGRDYPTGLARANSETGRAKMKGLHLWS